MRVRRATNSTSLRFTLMVNPSKHPVAAAYLDQHYDSDYIARLVEADLRNRGHVLTTQQGLEAYRQLRASIAPPPPLATAAAHAPPAPPASTEAPPTLTPGAARLLNSVLSNSEGTVL